MIGLFKQHKFFVSSWTTKNSHYNSPGNGFPEHDIWSDFDPAILFHVIGL